jgi:hypothetical protein
VVEPPTPSHQATNEGSKPTYDDPPDTVYEREDEREDEAAVTSTLPAGARVSRLMRLDNTLTPLAPPAAGGPGGASGGGGGGGGGGGNISGFQIVATDERRTMLYLALMGFGLVAGGIRKVGSFELSKDRIAQRRAKEAQGR